MSIRRLNFTNRKKLSRDRVRVQLEPAGPGSMLEAVLDLYLPDGLPGDARVILEAYRTSHARERFDLGTVAEAVIQRRFRQSLTQFEVDGPTPLFRLKVAEHRGGASGRIVAEARSIQPVLPDAQQRQGLLYTRWTELDGPVWELEVGPDRVVLVIEIRIDPGHELPTRPYFKALVYPEILRRVLYEALIRDDHVADDPESWQYQWARLPHAAFGFPDDIPGQEDARMEWIDSAVRWCARSAGLAKMMIPPEEA